ncbi:MAG TPA: DUF1579 family protein [Gemmatimonadaceae bacterium]|nr:DUF1579 family protein [Gemmatimonadaceae bacterium]
MNKSVRTQRKPGQIGTPHAMPSPGLKRLGTFVGTWHIEGRQCAGVVGPDAPVTAVETFEWLSGELFLIHRFQGQVGGADSACIEVIGSDASTRAYPVRTYYNTGVMNDWQYEDHGAAWIQFGEWTMGDERIHVRCTTHFSDDGNTRTGRWESSSDGVAWETFWDVTAWRATVTP